MPRNSEFYDKAYFDKWYRHPRHRVKSPTDVARQARFVVAAAEYLLERPVRTVLDVGSGEGNWLPALRKIRPGVRYYGVDASEYAVARWGRRRNIRLGTIGTLGTLGLPEDFDLVICCGVLMYLDADELRAGLPEIRRLSNGACYFEVFTSADDVTGDFDTRTARSPAWWRRELGRAGFVPCGLHVYLPRELEGVAAALERAT
jgi:SAM-dependent methyltransferase